MSKHFLFCFSLNTGALLMSFLNLLKGAVESVSSAIELSDLEAKQRLNSIARHFKITLIEQICNKTEICNSTSIHHRYGPEVVGVEGHITLFTVCLLIGLVTIFNGSLLLVGIIKGKEKYVLLYLLLGSAALFIETIYSGIYMFENGFLFLFFLLSVFMCYGQFAMYSYYEELREYNTVKSGVIEISFNGDPKSYTNSTVTTQRTVDNTAL